jgi:hypothetical protein
MMFYSAFVNWTAPDPHRCHFCHPYTTLRAWHESEADNVATACTSKHTQIHTHISDTSARCRFQCITGRHDRSGQAAHPQRSLCCAQTSRAPTLEEASVFDCSQGDTVSLTVSSAGLAVLFLEKFATLPLHSNST